MPYCQHCGAQLKDDYAICLNCGCKNKDSLDEESTFETACRWIIPVNRTILSICAGYLAIMAIAIPILAPLALLIGILALVDLKKHPEKLGRGRAWFGVIIGGIVTILLTVLIMWFLLSNQGPPNN